MITLPGVSWLSNSTDRILTPIFTNLFYLPCLLSGDRYGPPPSSLATNQPWHLGVTKYSWRVAFKPLKSESNLWLGTLFASWIFMSALLFFDGISELIRRANFILWSEVPAAAIGSWLHIQGPRCSHQRFHSCFVTLSSHDVDFVKQIKDKYVWMKHQNKALKCLFGCTEASASVNSFSKRIWGNDKNRLLLHAGLSLRFPFQCGHDGCSVTDVICLFHLAP